LRNPHHPAGDTAPAARHFPALERPDALAFEIGSFLAACRARAIDGRERLWKASRNHGAHANA